MTLNFFRPPKDSLHYGRKVCSRDHTDLSGRIVRRIGSGCWACQCKLPNGKFNFDFGDLPIQEFHWKSKYQTDEEKKAARVKHQIRWNNDNPEKFKAAQTRYASKPDVIERRKLRQAQYYQENKEMLKERNKANYHKRKEQYDSICKKSKSNTVSGMDSESTSNSIS